MPAGDNKKLKRDCPVSMIQTVMIYKKIIVIHVVSSHFDIMCSLGSHSSGLGSLPASPPGSQLPVQQSQWASQLALWWTTIAGAISCLFWRHISVAGLHEVMRSISISSTHFYQFHFALAVYLGSWHAAQHLYLSLPRKSGGDIGTVSVRSSVRGFRPLSGKVITQFISNFV